MDKAVPICKQHRTNANASATRNWDVFMSIQSLFLYYMMKNNGERDSNLSDLY
jgi:hypothetical protein